MKNFTSLFNNDSSTFNKADLEDICLDERGTCQELKTTFKLYRSDDCDAFFVIVGDKAIAAYNTGSEGIFWFVLSENCEETHVELNFNERVVSLITRKGTKTYNLV